VDISEVLNLQVQYPSPRKNNARKNGIPAFEEFSEEIVENFRIQAGINSPLKISSLKGTNVVQKDSFTDQHLWNRIEFVNDYSDEVIKQIAKNRIEQNRLDSLNREAMAEKKEKLKRKESKIALQSQLKKQLLNNLSLTPIEYVIQREMINSEANQARAMAQAMSQVQVLT